ncbi:MAG TPA: O-antigen ligase family protein [Pyrinomonadaceae bacterium]|jgi:tetratricopeptide (TPR) repeat protein/O-antigen ligase
MTAHTGAQHPAVAGDDPTPRTQPRASRTQPRASRTLAAVIFYALLSLIVLAPAKYGLVREWWVSLFQCVVFALAALWALEGLLGGGWFVREHRLLAPLVPLLLFVFLQSVPLGREEVAGVEVWRTLSADAYETRLAAFRFLAHLLVAAMLLRYTSNRRRLAALICAVLVAGVSSALFGLARRALHSDGEPFASPYLWQQLEYAPFNANHFALLLEMCLGLLLGLAAGAGALPRGLRLFLCLPAAALLWAALVLSTSRGGIFAAAGQIVFLALLWGVLTPRRRRHDEEKTAVTRRWFAHPLIVRWTATTCLLVALGFAAVWIGGDILMQRMESLRGEIGAQGAGTRDFPRRSRIWWATWQLIKEHPLAGTGFGGYWLAITPFFDASGIGLLEQAHNDYLELLASGGLVAIAAAALFGGLFIQRARECLRSGDPFRRAACCGALTGLCGVALHSFVDFGLHITANAHLFTALIVIAAAHVCADKRVQPARAVHAQDRAVRRSLKDLFQRASDGRVVRVASVALCLLCCGALMWATARAGLSRRYSVGQAHDYSLSLAERAIRLSPHDPTARYFRAELLLASGRNDAAREELQRAAELRPRLYSLWLRLGLVREAGGDLRGAMAALQEGVRLAPFYAEPRWVLGGALLRAGERERAFAEFSRAVASDPDFPPQALELLWEASGGDADAMAQAISPHTATARTALARFFVKRGAASGAAAALLRQAGHDAGEARRVITSELIAAKKFREAYDFWSSGRVGGAGAGRGEAGFITDGGFEGEINPQEFGFGWRVEASPGGLTVSSDTQGARAGARSLRLDFNGEGWAQSPLISQMVLVEKDSRYRLSFAARVQGMKSVWPPVLSMRDADSGEELASPIPLRGKTTGWQEFNVEFKTATTTAAVLFAIERQQCAAPPCWHTGRIWLDEFSLQKLTAPKAALLTGGVAIATAGRR